MDVRLLGSIAVTSTGEPTACPTGPPERLLALLAIRAGTAVPTEVLCRELELSPAELREAVTALQDVVGAHLVAAPPGHLRWTGDTDIAVFERLVAEAGAVLPEHGVALRDEALGLYAGPALAHLASEPWARAEAARLGELRADTVEEQAVALLLLGRRDDAVAQLTSLLTTHPHRDRPREALTRALATGSPPEVPTVEDRGDPGAPTGTLTFLFTDIEDSTGAWEADPESMQHDLYHHDRIVLAAIAKRNGHLFGNGGDGFSAAFHSATDAVLAAIECQVALRDHPWTGVQRTRVRMGLHTGTAEARANNYFGPVVNRGARLMGAANGDQIVVSDTTADLLEADHRVRLVDLGLHALKGIPAPMHVYGVAAEHHPWVDRALTAARSTLGNVARLPDEFVATNGQLTEVTAALRTHRLVTLLGPGGIGKTRLSIEAARAEASAFTDGIWLADLVPIGADDWVAHAVADAFGIRIPEGADPSDAIVADLSERRALLVLDNCEHVLAGAATLARRLLADCPHLTLVATSRQPLHLGGEWMVTLRPLDPRTDGVTLFIARAESAGVAIDPSADLEQIASICERLDGLPLAIELAAARVRTMTIDDIEERISDRFRLLRGGARGTHHETLHDTVGWSYELLDSSRQRFYACVCGFVGEFDLASAHQLWTTTPMGTPDADEFDVLELLNDLVDRSIVIADRSSGSATRYRLLETLREFGLAQLSSADRRALESAHVDHYAAVAAAADRQVRGTDWPAGVEAFTQSWSNIRAAVTTAIEHRDPDAVEDLLESVTFVTFMRDLDEPTAWAQAARRAMPDESGPSTSALVGLSLFWSGDMHAAVAALDAGLRAGPGPEQLLMLRYLKAVALFGMDRGQQGYDVLHEQMDEPASADALQPMVRSSHAAYGALTGNLTIAESAAGMAQSHRELSDRPNDAVAAVIAFNESFLAYVSDDHDTLQQLLLEVLDTSEEHGLHYMTELCLSVLSLLPGRTGLRWALAAVQRAEQHGNRALANHALAGGALILFAMGEVDTAARILGHLPPRGSAVGAARQRDVIEQLRARPDDAALLRRGAASDRQDILEHFDETATRVLAEGA